MRTTGRLAGLLYLVPLVCGPFSMMYVPSVVVGATPDETLARLVGAQALVRAGLASDLVIVVSEVLLTAVLFELFAASGAALMRAAAWARLTMVGLQAANVVVQAVALRVALSGPERAVTLGLVLDAHGLAVHAWEVAFALHCVLLGVVVLRVAAVPRALGPLLMLAGVGYALNGFGNFVAPALAGVFAAVVGVTAMVGEVPFVVWLVARGNRLVA